MKEIHLQFDLEWTPAISLQAGELQCLYEAGKLRYIKRGGTVLISMIYAAVRDGNWGTLPYKIEDEKLVIEKENFTIQFTAVYGQEKPVYKAFFTIEGKADSRISFSMQGTALAAFQKNRIGICVHHPVSSCSGQSVMVTRPDGTSYQSVFPEMISPHQPLLEIQQMQWTTADKTTVELFFEGDIFEMEDQRNWSDSSYKTYSTPQRIPFPVNVLPADTMQQKVTMIAFNSGESVAPQTKISSEEKVPFPAIGYSRSGDRRSITVAEAALLQKIPFSHYRLLLQMDQKNWMDDLHGGFAEAALLHTRLELVIVFPEPFNVLLLILLAKLKRKQNLLYSILILQKNKTVLPHALQARVYRLVKEVLPAVPVGYGTDHNFVDLNRQQPVADVFDFTSYSIHPQAHMTDNRSVWENLDNQPDMIAAASAFSAGKPVFISPLTLKDRYDGKGADKRQYTSLIACWTLMSIQQLATAGSITLYELFGEAGLLRVEKNNDGEDAEIHASPVYEMLVAIQAFQPVFIIKRYMGGVIIMDGLLLENATGERLFFKMPPEIISAKNQ